MADYRKIQKRLNEDKRFKADFLKSPARVLEKEGHKLTPEMKRSVGYLVDRVKRPGHFVPGAGIAPQDLAAVTITIGVDF